MLEEKIPKERRLTVLAAVGIAAAALAAGWFVAKRLLGPSTRYEALQEAPVSSPM